MKRRLITSYLILGILLILFHVVAFVIPSEKTPTFFTAYGFTLAALLAQVGIIYLSLGRSRKEELFLKLPALRVGMIYLVVQLIAFAVFFALPWLPVWSAVLVGAVILGIAAICLTAVAAGSSAVRRSDQEVGQKVFYLRELQSEIELLAERTAGEKKPSYQKLAEQFRFSDPMSHPQLQPLEEELREKVTALCTAGADEADALQMEVEQLLARRNKMCKLLKNERGPDNFVRPSLVWEIACYERLREAEIEPSRAESEFFDLIRAIGDRLFRAAHV